MMKRSLLIASALALVSMNTHARFSQADAWMGMDQQPITLNKYAYGNANPVNYIDPTGNFSLAEFGAVSNIQSQMLLATTATIGVGTILYGTSRSDMLDNPGIERDWGVWDVIAATKYGAGMARTNSISKANAQAKAEAIAMTAAGTKLQGHHTIPIYLCGRKSQILSYIDTASHVRLHTGLGLAKIALTAAEEKANKMLPSFTKNRTKYALSLADSELGRKTIASSIGRFYQRGGWMSQGHPTIGTVFPGEKKLFIAGETSRPSCIR